MTIKGNTHEKLKLLAEFLIQKAAVGRGRVNRPSLRATVSVFTGQQGHGPRTLSKRKGMPEMDRSLTL